MADAPSPGAGPSTTWPSPPAYDFEIAPHPAATVDGAKETARGSFFRSARWYVRLGSSSNEQDSRRHCGAYDGRGPRTAHLRLVSSLLIVLQS